MALRAFVEDCASYRADIAAMADGRLRRLFWRGADHLDYLVRLARLRILDAVCGSRARDTRRSAGGSGIGSG
jgi:hypothetical protein